MLLDENFFTSFTPVFIESLIFAVVVQAVVLCVCSLGYEKNG